ncbi:MAG: TetR/AcrR family transcriptional regulator [Rubrivivax sp.]|nr:TetR/AcrR family transcriptional regulator [Rubrivivax sp.]
MPRPPHARQAVLEAAEAIVKELGAAHLTFDAIVKRSGITRGGVTYHFPTKDALLAALVEHDIGRWQECIARQRARRAATSPANAELVAYLESGCEPDEEVSRLCAGLLSATSTQKELTQRWRAFFSEHLAHARASGDPALAMLLMLAVDGLFWLETLGLSTLDTGERQALVGRIVALGEDLPVATTPRVSDRVPDRGPAPRRRARGTRP